MLKSDNENYLCAFDKTDIGFENPKVIPIESNYQSPYKILINYSQSNGGVLIYLKDNTLISYNENLEFLMQYGISEPDENTILDIKDAFVNGGKLYLLDNSNNIYVYLTDLPQ